MRVINIKRGGVGRARPVICEMRGGNGSGDNGPASDYDSMDLENQREDLGQASNGREGLNQASRLSEAESGLVARRMFEGEGCY